jgi:hypothetical protein
MHACVSSINTVHHYPRDKLMYSTAQATFVSATRTNTRSPMTAQPLTVNYKQVDYTAFRHAIDHPSNKRHSSTQQHILKQQKEILIAASDNSVLAKMSQPHVDRHGEVHEVRYFLPVTACKLPAYAQLSLKLTQLLRSSRALMRKCVALRQSAAWPTWASNPHTAIRQLASNGNTRQHLTKDEPCWTTIRLTA